MTRTTTARTAMSTRRIKSLEVAFLLIAILQVGACQPSGDMKLVRTRRQLLSSAPAMMTMFSPHGMFGSETMKEFIDCFSKFFHIFIMGLPALFGGSFGPLGMLGAGDGGLSGSLLNAASVAAPEQAGRANDMLNTLLNNVNPMSPGAALDGNARPRNLLSPAGIASVAENVGRSFFDPTRLLSSRSHISTDFDDEQPKSGSGSGDDGFSASSGSMSSVNDDLVRSSSDRSQPKADITPAGEPQPPTHAAQAARQPPSRSDDTLTQLLNLTTRLPSFTRTKSASDNASPANRVSPPLRREPPTLFTTKNAALAGTPDISKSSSSSSSESDHYYHSDSQTN